MNHPDADISSTVAPAIAAARVLVEGRLGARAEGFWTPGETRRLEEAVASTLRGELPESPPPGPRASREDLALGEEAVGEFERVVSERLGLDYAGMPGARSRIGDVFERYAEACRASRRPRPDAAGT